MKTNSKLVRDQLQMKLDGFQPLADTSVPPKGWIRAVRDALGMSGRQLGERMGVSKQRASFIEKQEIDGTLTLKTMRRAAESLDCVFVYGLVPRKSLERTVRRRARRLARERLARASHTMSLEDQALGRGENREMLSDMTQEIVDRLPSDLWDD